ncbi:putative leader peptide [Streptomyces sp. R41]|uniref:Leader peptide n=1 Tax=Streptomyces sp. R41 TaxID=3238632 RepID=A0AB39RWC9_9ACTN
MAVPLSYMMPNSVEVMDMLSASRLPVRELAPRRRVRLHTRPHIDLLRVAGALCCA